jgi:hypothetical protein
VSVILKPGEPGVSITPEPEYLTKEAVHRVYAAFTKYSPQANIKPDIKADI